MSGPHRLRRQQLVRKPPQPAFKNRVRPHEAADREFRGPQKTPEIWHTYCRRRYSPMAKKPTTADAHLILELYDLRREAEMRKARNWWGMEFFPQSADDFMKVIWAPGTPENNWLRQVSGYWNIVASFVLSGVLNEELFLQPGFSGELFLIYAKVHPYVKELRQKLDDPEFYLNIEKAVTRTKWGRNRLQFMIKRVETMRQRIAAARKAS